MSSAPGKAAPWIQWLARIGYAARGVVFILIGGAAVQAAFSVTERPEGSSGALLFILRQPFGRVLLAIVAAGLAGFVVWRLVQALLDPEHLGKDAKGLMQRAGRLISGLIYAGLAVEAIRLLLGSGGGNGDSADHWTRLAMSQPTGRWVVGIVGGGIILFGFYELYRAFTADLEKKMDLSHLRTEAREGVIRFGHFGMGARGVVFLVVGWFLIQAALHYNPSEAQGFASALRTLREQAYGKYLLGTVALGLIAYGGYQLAEARYRVIRAVD